jgi:hypothetical protein
LPDFRWLKLPDDGAGAGYLDSLHEPLLEESTLPYKRLFGLREWCAKASRQSGQQRPSPCLCHRAFKPSNNAQAFVTLVLSRHTMEGGGPPGARITPRRGLLHCCTTPEG